ncbi:MAG TPA: CHAT domain-containing protein [Thermoanaerobaculia bacterium]|nr:CHAT domain-containing protein [Thermoanaerobaculia bacterium]
MKGDTTAAEEKLRLARALADALHTRSGESLARDAIDAIDEAARTQGAVARLARAYSIYGQGRALLGAYDFAEAEVRLAEASSLFALAKSPMASVARYYEATAILEQNRVDEAAARYGELAMAEDAMGGHRALAADLDWQIARAEGMRGHWDAALHAAQEAVDGYRALGETQNAGFMENMLAELYDYLAQPERSWSHRLVAFALLSEAGYAHPLQVSLGAAARERIRRKDWPAAIALLDLEIAGSQRADQASLRVDALARRARARASNGDTAGARSDVAAARAAAESVKDPNERALVIAGIDVAEGIVEREYDSGRSIGLFTNAIGFYQKASKPILLPEIHLERGRLHLARGEAEKGLADFSRGIDLLEQQRAALSDFDLYSTVSDVGADLYAEAVRLAVSIGDVERAYRFSEHSRGRAIIKWMAATDVAAPARAPQDTRIVELMVLPEKVVVFTVDRTLEMQELDIGRAKLEQLVASFRASIAGDGPSDRARASGAALYDALLRPLGAVSTGVSTLVIVPTGILEGVPWAALYDRESGRYLVENVSVVTAPSATVYTRIGERNAVRSPRALVVGNPKIADDTMGLPVLSGAEREARAISAMYRSPTLLLGADATIPRFEREVKMCDVLHFAGHAVSSETVDDQSFLVLAAGRGPGESGMLYSRDITKLDLRGVSLVVLAACGTIRGPTVHVDGMPSIGRAFIAAGAKAVIGTLWDVDDDRSRALFTRIHRAVSMGVPVGQALRGAQIEAIRSGDPRLAHPNAWGSVTLIGGG